MLHGKKDRIASVGSAWGDLAPLEWTNGPTTQSMPFEQSGMEHCALGIRPAYTPQGSVCAIRLQINRLSLGQASSASDIWETAEDVARAIDMPLWLRVNSTDWLQSLLNQTPHHLLSVEVPTFMVATTDLGAQLERMARGPGLVLFGRPETSLSTSILDRTNCVIIDRDDERRRPLLRDDTQFAEIRRVPFFHDNCSAAHHLEQAVGAGAIGVLGHEAFERPSPHELGINPLVEDSAALLRQVLSGGSIAGMVDVLRNRPQLMPPLLALMNCAELGSKRSIESIEEAMTLSMRSTLTRALAVLMHAHGHSAADQVQRFAVVRRALFVDNLLASIGHGEFQEMGFVATVLASSEGLLGQSLDSVGRNLRLPVRLRDALAGHGNLAPWMRLAELSDSASPAQLAIEASSLLLSQADLNTALLRSVVQARRVCQRLDAAPRPGAMH